MGSPSVRPPSIGCRCSRAATTTTTSRSRCVRRTVARGWYGGHCHHVPVCHPPPLPFTSPTPSGWLDDRVRLLVLLRRRSRSGCKWGAGGRHARHHTCRHLLADCHLQVTARVTAGVTATSCRASFCNSNRHRYSPPLTVTATGCHFWLSSLTAIFDCHL